MEASTEFQYVDMEAQEAPKQKPAVVEFEDIDTIDPMQFASLLAANERQLKTPLGNQADLDDAIEIELDAGQMDALLDGSWQP
jgi:hypothetical protein